MHCLHIVFFYKEQAIDLFDFSAKSKENVPSLKNRALMSQSFCAKKCKDDKFTYVHGYNESIFILCDISEKYYS